MEEQRERGIAASQNYIRLYTYYTSHQTIIGDAVMVVVMVMVVTMVMVMVMVVILYCRR